MKPTLQIRRFPAAHVTGLVLCGILSLAATGEFSALVKRLQQEKPEFARRHQTLLAQRYDLSDRPAPGSFCP